MQRAWKSAYIQSLTKIRWGEKASGVAQGAPSRGPKGSGGSPGYKAVLCSLFLWTACARFCLSAKAFPSVCFRAGSTALSAAGSGVRIRLENKAGLLMAERRLQGVHLSLRACKGLVFKQKQLFSWPLSANRENAQKHIFIGVTSRILGWCQH